MKTLKPGTRAARIFEEFLRKTCAVSTSSLFFLRETKAERCFVAGLEDCVKESRGVQGMGTYLGETRDREKRNS